MSSETIPNPTAPGQRIPPVSEEGADETPKYAILRCSRPSSGSDLTGMTAVVIGVHDTYYHAQRAAMALSDEINRKRPKKGFSRHLYLITDPETFAYGGYDEDDWLEIRPIADGKIYDRAGPMTFWSQSNSDTEVMWNERADETVREFEFQGLSADATPGTQVDWVRERNH